MTGTTHVAIAIAGALAYSAAAGQSPDALGWTMVVIGGLAPDIDGGGTIARPGSLFGKLLPRWLARLVDHVAMTISRAIRAVLGHRTATHWPLWAGLMIYFGGNSWLFWLGLGWALHILGDFCTVSGVPLFGPLLTRDIKWSPIRTGTWPEWLVISPAVWGVIFYYGWAYIPPHWVARLGHSFNWEAVWNYF